MENQYENFTEIKPLVDLKIIRETLARMGIANKKDKILYPSCYLIRNFEEYYIVHFKELFLMTRKDGYNNISSEDIERKNAIIFNLKNWKLIDVDDSLIENHSKFVFVLRHDEKKNYKIYHKFNINNIEILN